MALFRQIDGLRALFLFVVNALQELLLKTVAGLGFELVDIEMSPRGRLIRVFIDKQGKEGGVDVEDCASISNHLTRLLEVEGVDYDRLEVSSPGLDRPVKKAEDFVRFAGQDIQIKLRLPVNARRHFQGALLGCIDGQVMVRLESGDIALALENIDKARLVPRFK